MARLEAMGITVRMTRQTTELAVGEGAGRLKLGESTRTRVELRLPRATGVRASFAKEGFVSSVAKVFTKELQTGDAEFDAAVYIKTSTPDAAAALLARADVRQAIGLLIAGDSPIEIDDAIIRTSLPGENDDADDPSLLVVVGVLLGG